MKSMFMDRVDEFQLNCSDGFFTLVNFEQFQVECASGAASKPINHIRLCIWVRIYSWGTRRARSIYRIQPAIHKRTIWYRFIRFFLNLIIFFGCALCFYLQHVRTSPSWNEFVSDLFLIFVYGDKQRLSYTASTQHRQNNRHIRRKKQNSK